MMMRRTAITTIAISHVCIVQGGKSAKCAAFDWFFQNVAVHCISLHVNLIGLNCALTAVMNRAQCAPAHIVMEIPSIPFWPCEVSIVFSSVYDLKKILKHNLILMGPIL